MAPSNHLRVAGLFAASLLLSGVVRAASADTLSGTGYIDLYRSSSAPAPATTAGDRFFWDNSNLFIGNAAAGRNINPGNSVSIFGADVPLAGDSVSLLGQAGYGGVAIRGINESGGGVAISGTAYDRGMAIMGMAGDWAVAIGHEATAASGVAIGYKAKALSPFSIAISSHYDGGGGATATSEGAIAVGVGANGAGLYSTALGLSASSPGLSSTALGHSSFAGGSYSIAIGDATTSGNNATAIGLGTVVSAHGSVALGRYNIGNIRKDGTTVTTAEDAGDPLLTLGNGTGTATNQRANAFTVYRDGTAQVSGLVAEGAGTITGSTTTGLTLQAGGTNKDIVLDASGTGKIVLNDNVGIGTANPDYQLTVNGTIHAKEVLVDNAILPDYVFADDYRNAPLSEVEAHIKEHRHLPGVPSAREVAERGINISQMQNALLAKVEELTLHLIAQEKRIERLEAENAALRAN